MTWNCHVRTETTKISLTYNFCLAMGVNLYKFIYLLGHICRGLFIQHNFCTLGTMYEMNFKPKKVDTRFSGLELRGFQKNNIYLFKVAIVQVETSCLHL